MLTYLPVVPHKCVSEWGQHCSRQWLVAYLAQSRYINQCWIIINWTLRNKLKWNFNQNKKIFIHENASENIVCEIAAILSRGRWVKVMARYHEATILLPGPQFNIKIHLIGKGNSVVEMRWPYDCHIFTKGFPILEMVRRRHYIESTPNLIFTMICEVIWHHKTTIS